MRTPARRTFYFTKISSTIFSASETHDSEFGKRPDWRTIIVNTIYQLMKTFKMYIWYKKILLQKNKKSTHCAWMAVIQIITATEIPSTMARSLITTALQHKSLTLLTKIKHQFCKRRSLARMHSDKLVSIVYLWKVVDNAERPRKINF